MPSRLIKYAFTAIVIFFSTLPASADDLLDGFFEQLQTASAAQVPNLQDKIRGEWSKTGSAALDLLLGRGVKMLPIDPIEAEGHFSAAIDHGPDVPQAYMHRAQARIALGLWGPALADLEMALALEPRHFDALMLLASIYEELGDAQKALAIWALVADLAPQSPEVAQALARLLGAEGVEA